MDWIEVATKMGPLGGGPPPWKRPSGATDTVRTRVTRRWRGRALSAPQIAARRTALADLTGEGGTLVLVAEIGHLQIGLAAGVVVRGLTPAGALALLYSALDDTEARHPWLLPSRGRWRRAPDPRDVTCHNDDLLVEQRFLAASGPCLDLDDVDPLERDCRLIVYRLIPCRDLAEVDGAF